MNPAHIAILHYSAPPTVGGVESVMHAHAHVLLEHGYAVTLIAGSGSPDALPSGCDFIHLPLLDSQHPQVLEVNAALEAGQVTDDYRQLRERIKTDLAEYLPNFEHLIVHNVFSKHFNLALTDALHELLDEGLIPHCIAWCHDLSWASERSLPVLHDGQPWNLLRHYRPEVDYVVVSRKRRYVMAETFNMPADQIRVIYNGIDEHVLLGIDPASQALIEPLHLAEAELFLLMPVRVTQAKNIEFALHVLKELRDRECNAMMVLTGPPDPHDPDNLAYFQDLLNLRAKLGLQDAFRFAYEIDSGGKGGTILDMETVGGLYRLSDALFMPSWREGFGMPILEAGFLGKPVFASDIPAVEEIGGEDVHHLDIHKEPVAAATQILDWAAQDPLYRLRKKTRENYTWEQIFRKQIEPLLSNGTENA
ncbi:MAG: hypothetical protein PWQ55_1760 [Chloroflexota bacterium]|nr:hypothetical protein [Chloroflexota bacterium]